MDLPAISDEQRLHYLDIAMTRRQARAATLDRIRRHELALPELFKLADEDDAVGRMKLKAALLALPGVGPVTAGQWLAETSVDGERRRLRGVGATQRKRLIALAERQVKPLDQAK
jgi:hypothetical protein